MKKKTQIVVFLVQPRLWLLRTTLVSGDRVWELKDSKMAHGETEGLRSAGGNGQAARQQQDDQCNRN